MRFSRLPEELPAEAVNEREYCLQSGLRSQLTVPFKVGASILGGIGFGSFRRHDWSDELVQSLQLVGEVFANAMERKRAELVLRESEARLRHLLESTRAVPWVADAESWLMTYVGRQAVNLLGYPLEDWYEGQFWADHIHPEDREEAVAFCLDHIGRATDFEFEYRMLAADGRTVWVHDIVHVVAENGAPRTLQGFLIDVTARRRAEEETRTLRDQLVRVGRVTLMGELAASIAHEVNQPLCAVVSNAQAVQRMLAAGTFDPAEVREALQDITGDGQRASAVIARIRRSLQQGPPERSPLDVNDLVREVFVLIRREMARRGAAVRLELSKRLPLVLGDRVQLQQVVLNLIGNGADALDHVAPDRRQPVIISTADGPSGVTVGVKDFGAGIDPADVNRVFDTFFTTKPGGMGMGLAICKSIIQAHGGRIWARPNEGPGATIALVLPAIRGADA
jgi:PAS domain S-box-containing protein